MPTSVYLTCHSSGFSWMWLHCRLITINEFSFWHCFQLLWFEQNTQSDNIYQYAQTSKSVYIYLTNDLLSDAVLTSDSSRERDLLWGAAVVPAEVWSPEITPPLPNKACAMSFHLMFPCSSTKCCCMKSLTISLTAFICSSLRVSSTSQWIFPSLSTRPICFAIWMANCLIASASFAWGRPWRLFL